MLIGLRKKLMGLSWMKFKFGVHAVQAVLTVIAWILTIAVIAKPGGTSSATYWYFALTWFTLIALAYQALIPLWERTKRYKNLYACLALDGLFAIFWASAFGSVQAWTASGIPHDSTGYCQGFLYGDSNRCTISFGSVMLGSLIFVLFLIASGISAYKVWYFRKNGYCLSQRPSISKPAPVEAKFVYPDDSQSFERPSDQDPEKGAYDAPHGLAPRKLSWDAAPLSAPACAPEFPEAKPMFRAIDYNGVSPTEKSPLTQCPPINRRPVTNSRMVPPKLQLYGPGDRTPALMMDYGATTPYGAPTPYQPPANRYSNRYSNRPYAPSPTSHNPYRGSMAPAPYTAAYNNNNYNNQNYGTNHNQQNYNPQAGSHNSYMAGYRGNYASGIPPTGYDNYNRRDSAAMRMALPGPASTHAGGYHSAYHTPLPSAMMSPGRGGGYHGFKRESTIQFYSQQQAFADKGLNAR